MESIKNADAIRVYRSFLSNIQPCFFVVFLLVQPKVLYFVKLSCVLENLTR